MDYMKLLLCGNSIFLLNQRVMINIILVLNISEVANYDIFYFIYYFI